MNILDVRTKNEFDEGHIDGAIYFNIMDMMSGAFPDISKESEIFVYCESGNRSMMSKSLLNKAGFINVVDGGGIDSFAKTHNLKIV